MKFKIAEHILSLSIPEQYNYMLTAYQPFICSDDETAMYDVNVVDKINYEITSTLFEDTKDGDDGMVTVNIYKTTDGVLYNIIMPRSEIVNAQLHITQRVASIAINEDGSSKFSQATSFHNAMILNYITFTISKNTLLLHASAILKDGKAHLFLGKSGTGKSTHSRMWQECFADAELLNDDHPVIRQHDKGEVIAYGSPWSGKTPCYRNISAPLAAIIRIKRAPHNKLQRLSTLRSYASIMTSCSGVQWIEELSAAKVKSLGNIIANVDCYEMECLPNNDAAICCYESLNA